MSKTGIFTSNLNITILNRGRGWLRPLFLFLLSSIVNPGYPENIQATQALAHDRLGDITEGEMTLYLRSKERDSPSIKRDTGVSWSDIEEYSIIRILAASAEADLQGFLDTPPVRWGLWKLHTAEAYLRFEKEIFTPKRDPSPKEIEEYYQDHQKDFEEKGHIRFRSIFLDATRCPDEKCRKDLRQKAGQILANLVDGSTVPVVVPLERFLAVASEATGQPTFSFEVRGPFSLGQISPTIEKAALSLEPEEVGPLIKVKHGYQILRLESKAVPGIHPLNEVRARIRETLRVRETQTRRRIFVNRMLDSGRLEISEEGLAALLKSATDPQQASQMMLSPAFDGGLTVGDYLDYMTAFGMPLRKGDDSDEKVIASHRDTIQRFLLVPDLTYQEAVAAGFTSETTFQERLKVGRILFLGNLYLKHLVKIRLESQPRITPEEITTYYDSHLDKFMSKEEYRLREIAARPRDATSPPGIEFAYREAEGKVLMALKEIQEGSPEESIIQQVSQGPEAAQGGLVGWTLYGTRYSADIWKVLSETPTGAWIGQVFRFGNQVVSLKVEERKASERLALAECSLEILNKLEQKRYEAEKERVEQEVQKGAELTE